MTAADVPLLTRREFLRRTAVATAGTALVGCSDPTGPSRTPGRLTGDGVPKRVGIVGAGVSGLVAGYELTRAGHDVRIFEARDRVGGRVLTLREPFAEGHLAEAGAARIRPEHDLTLGYARHFGLDIVRFYPDSGRFLQVAGDDRVDLSTEAFLTSRPAYLKIRGGTDRLPEAFATALESRVVTGAPVAGVERFEGGARLVGAAGWTFDTDRILCTVPVPALDTIDFAPPLSAEKARSVAGDFDYRPATRLFVRFRSRFWSDDGRNGWADTDWPEEIWHPTWDLPGPEGVLLTYVRGERALELDALDGDERVRRVLARWEESVFTEATAHFVSGVSHSWQDDPWSRGAWAAPTPSQDAELGGHVARREGPVHFAGEHASSWRGWMQGALESGLRAAREIHRAAVA